MLLKASITGLPTGVYAVHRGYDTDTGVFSPNGFCFYCDYIEYDSGFVACYYKGDCIARLSPELFDDHDIEMIVGMFLDLRV